MAEKILVMFLHMYAIGLFKAQLDCFNFEFTLTTNKQNAVSRRHVYYLKYALILKLVTLLQRLKSNKKKHKF